MFYWYIVKSFQFHKNSSKKSCYLYDLFLLSMYVLLSSICMQFEITKVILSICLSFLSSLHHIPMTKQIFHREIGEQNNAWYFYLGNFSFITHSIKINRTLTIFSFVCFSSYQWFFRLISLKQSVKVKTWVIKINADMRTNRKI